jgi:hypothetical protein
MFDLNLEIQWVYQYTVQIVFSLKRKPCKFLKIYSCFGRNAGVSSTSIFDQIETIFETAADHESQLYIEDFLMEKKQTVIPMQYFTVY